MSMLSEVIVTDIEYCNRSCLN